MLAWKCTVLCFLDLQIINLFNDLRFQMIKCCTCQIVTKVQNHDCCSDNNYLVLIFFISESHHQRWQECWKDNSIPQVTRSKVQRRIPTHWWNTGMNFAAYWLPDGTISKSITYFTVFTCIIVSWYILTVWVLNSDSDTASNLCLGTIFPVGTQAVWLNVGDSAWLQTTWWVMAICVMDHVQHRILYDAKIEFCMCV